MHNVGQVMFFPHLHRLIRLLIQLILYILQEGVETILPIMVPTDPILVHLFKV
jgi:hypothetical protein